MFIASNAPPTLAVRGFNAAAKQPQIQRTPKGLFKWLPEPALEAGKTQLPLSGCELEGCSAKSSLPTRPRLEISDPTIGNRDGRSYTGPFLSNACGMALTISCEDAQAPAFDEAQTKQPCCLGSKDGVGLDRQESVDGSVSSSGGHDQHYTVSMSHCTSRCSFSSVSSGEVEEDLSLHERTCKRAIGISLPDVVQEIICCQSAVSPSALVRTSPRDQHPISSCLSQGLSLEASANGLSEGSAVAGVSCLPDGSVDAVISRFCNMAILSSSITVTDKMTEGPDSPVSPQPAACTPGTDSELASFEWISGDRFDFEGDEYFFPQLSPTRSSSLCKEAD